MPGRTRRLLSEPRGGGEQQDKSADPAMPICHVIPSIRRIPLFRTRYRVGRSSNWTVLGAFLKRFPAFLV